MAASANSKPTSQRCVRTAENAGFSPPRASDSTPCESTPSAGPGELGGRKSGLPLVLDPKRVDPRVLGFRHCQVRADGMEHAVEPDRPPRVYPERDDVLDLELDHVADANAVTQAIVLDLEARSLGAEHLSHQW